MKVPPQSRKTPLGVILMAGLLISTSPTLLSAEIPLSIDAKIRSASLTVPKASGGAVIEYKVPFSSKWIRYKTIPVKASPSTVRVELPVGYAGKSWRATGLPVAPVQSKYPAKFFSGKKSFSPSAAPAYADQASSGTDQSVGDVAGTSLKTTVVASAPSVAANTTASAATVEESDIWKTDGTTAYFFNQLRGLQVIDLADPSQPSLRAVYRLPAKGQDLYVLSGPGEIRYALLLTRERGVTSWWGDTGVKLVKVEGTSATLVASLTISGYLADSRMVGNRLYLATQQWAWSGGSGQDSITLSEVVADSSTGTLAAGNSQTVTGSWPVISAGSDWLAISGSDWSDWQTTQVTLFSLDGNGATRLTSSPLRLFGRVYDKEFVRYADGTLSAVSQKWVSESNAGWWWNGTQVTTLENFSANGNRLASLEIIRGEQLHAARFDGSKAYVVTAQQVDPLFVVDLADATNPVIAGQVEVPGWSTHIEPVGNGKLFTIGYDANWKVAASLFDVSNPASPALLSRVLMSGNWGYSPATYDDKALKVLPDEGLVLVPYTASGSTNGTTDRYVQLLNIDPAAGTLSLAGTITHRFDPLRASVVGQTLASISQKELVTASVADHSNPVLLASQLLAWPVNRVLVSGNHLLQITEGSSWTGDGPSLMVSSLSEPDFGLGEIDLGNGQVKDALLQNGKLFVLRQDPPDTAWGGWWPVMPLARFASGSGTVSTNSPSLFLDIYDAARLPDLPLVGRVSTKLPGNDASWDVGSLLQVSSNALATVVQPQSRIFRWWGPVVCAQPAVMAKSVASDVAVACCVYPGYRQPDRSTNPASAIVFQVTDPTVPSVKPPVVLTASASTPVRNAVAGSGLLVYGYGNKETPWGQGSTDLTSTAHYLRILDLQDPSSPVLGPALGLPGRLQGVSDLSRDGFLAWTETYGSGRQIQVSACNLSSLSLVANLPLSQRGLLSTSGRSLFAVQGNGLNRYTLTDAGSLLPSGSIVLDWSPSSLRVAGTSPLRVLGSDGAHLLDSTWNATNGTPVSWMTDRSVDLPKSAPLTSGGVASPVGDYGVDLFNP